MRPALIALLAALPLATCAQTPQHTTASVAIQRMTQINATYTDPAHGVSFRYPGSWAATKQFGYHPGAIAYNDPEPNAGFGYSAAANWGKVGRPFYRTPTEGFGIVYSARPAADAPACERIANDASADGSEPTVAEAVTVGPNQFHVRTYSSAGMNQSVSGDLYSTFHNGTCFLFELDIAQAGSGVAESLTKSGPKDPADSIDMGNILLNVLKTVRFTTAVATNTFRDPASGVSFDYPTVWKIVSGPDDYCSPAIFPRAGQAPDRNMLRPVVTVEFRGDGNYYANTELASLAFTFGKLPHSDARSCRKLIADSSRDAPTEQTIHGKQFNVGNGGECGLSHSVDAKLFSAIHGDTCYVFEEDFFTARPDEARDLTKSEMNALQRHLDAIMQSVQFTPKP